MTAAQHRAEMKALSQAEWQHMLDEYRERVGESEHEAAVRDLNHVLELKS